MKSLVLIILALPLFYACSKGDSGASPGPAGGGAPQPEKKDPTPTPPPANRDLVVRDANGFEFSAEVSENGRTVVVYPREKVVHLHLDRAMVSAGISFILRDGSLRSGCTDRVDQLKGYRDDIRTAHGDADLVSISLKEIENERTELAYEAGYFNAKATVGAIPDPVLDLALKASHDAGFAGTDVALPASITGVNADFADNSLGVLTEGETNMSSTYGRLLENNFGSLRVLNGELCELLLGTSARALVGGRGVKSVELRVVVEGLE